MSLKNLKEGADILQQVDVTEIITSLATGIADAQKKLDTNSIQQAIALADPNNGVGGKSLIELGFAPAFYHFQHAEVSAEIDLKMRLKTDFELNASLYGSFTKQGGYTKEKLNFLREDSESKERREYKSSRAIVTTATHYEEIAFDSGSVQMDETKGSIERIEKFEDDLRTLTEIDRVATKLDSKSVSIQVDENVGAVVNYVGGYLTITIPEDNAVIEGILKVADYKTSSTAIDMAGDATAEFTIVDGDKDDFTKVITAATTAIGAGTVTGFNDDKYQVGTGVAKTMEVFFDHDKRNAAVALDKTVSEDGVSKDNTAMREVLLKLAKALKNDSTTSIKLIGYTDGSGKGGYNETLSIDRCLSLKQWFEDQGVKSSQINHEGKGETLAGADESRNLLFRKVTIEVNGVDYFYMEGGNMKANATPDSGVNSFVHLAAVPGGPSSYNAKFTLNGEKIEFTGLTNANASLTGNSTWTTKLQSKFSHKAIRNTAYLLHNDINVKYTVFSRTKDDLSVRTGSNEKEDFTSEESKYLIGESLNKRKLVNKDLEKRENPSTVAVGGSVDLRTARQFEMEVKGNSRVSARLVSLPAPPEFLAEIKEYYKE